MAGIYIHIPFCKSRCTYCDFFMGTNESYIDAFVGAVCTEAIARKHEAKETIGTVYFGGGTPSRLHRHHFEQIFNTLHQHYSIEQDAEITVEANPDDLTDVYVGMLADLPFNRISIGIQSFDDAELQFLSRRHNARQAMDAVHRCQQKGFHNISIDLMYGLPKQTTTMWKQSLDRAISLDIQHISSYHLIYEERTRMYRLLQKGEISAVGEEQSTEMFAMLIDTLTATNFIHYEISAFGKEGFFSRHNCSYWKDIPYIGLGPSAHSYDGERRSWNVRSILRYIESAKDGGFEREQEQLNLQEQYNEYILTGLRTMWGIDMQEIEKRFGSEYRDYCQTNIHPFVKGGMVHREGNRFILSREGIFISDGIMSELMSV